MDGCGFSRGVDSGVEVDGGVGECGCSEVDGGFRMTSINIGFLTTVI